MTNKDSNGNENNMLGEVALAVSGSELADGLDLLEALDEATASEQNQNNSVSQNTRLRGPDFG